MNLIFHPQAAKDARSIASGYSEVSEELVARFWLELDVVIESITLFPERHHFDPSGFRRANLRKFPHHVLFEQLVDGVRIMVVRHDHRNPSYGLRRR